MGIFTKIKNIIGIQIEDIKIIEKLENLGFVIDDQIINVPSYRSDINSINDICEEIVTAKFYKIYKNTSIH